MNGNECEFIELDRARCAGMIPVESLTFSGAFLTLEAGSHVHSCRSGYPNHSTKYLSFP